MPRNTREWARRKLVMAAGNLDTAATHLIEMSNPYREPPQIDNIVEAAEALATSCLSLKNAIDEFRDAI